MTRHVSGTAARTALHGYLAEVHAETGRFVLLTGPVLSGKTSLVDAFAHSCHDRGLRVLSADCSRFSRHDLLTVPRQLLRGHRWPAGTRTESFSPSQAVETAVLEILELAATGRLIVRVDDIRHADPASVRFVESLAAGIGHHPVLAVVTDRTDATHGSIWLRGHLDQLRHVRTLALGPLSETDVTDLARTEFALRGAADRFAARLHLLSGGNALLTRALLHDHAARCGCHGEREDTRPPLIGPAYRQAVLDCLHRLDPDTRDIAEALAVADGFSVSEVIAELARMDPPAVEEATAELATCGLLRDGGFRHPAIREVILGDMPRNRRFELSARAATVLRAAGTPTEDVARWLSAMGDVDHTGTRAPRTLPRARWQQSAEETWEASGAAAAGTLLSSATAAGEALLGPGIGPVAGEGASGGVGEGPGERPRPALEDHRTLWLAKDELTLLDRRIAAISRRESTEHLELVARRLLLGCDFPGLLREVRGRERPARRILEERLTRSPHYAAAWALSSALAEDGADGKDAVKAAKRALYGCDPTEENIPTIMAALTTVVRHDDPQQALFWCDRFADQAPGRLACREARLRVVRSEIALRGGDATMAAAQAEKALGLLPSRFWGIRIAEPLACAVLANVAAGDPASAAVLLSRKVPDYLFDTRYGLDYLYARGLHRLAAGESLAGLADFLRCGGLMADWGFDRHRLIPWRLAVAAAYVTMNEYGKAVDWIDETFAMTGAARGGSAKRTDRLRERSDFGEAVFERLRETAGTPELFRTLEGLRNGHTENRKKSEIPRYKIYDRNSTYLEKLSPSEQRVAVLAAKGSTNQQIAHDLSITVSTVEQHLTRIYRKLQLARRSELRARLG